MKTGDKQSEKLPTTTSSIITESKGTFLGLDGMGFLVVVFGATIVGVVFYPITDHAPPIAAVAGLCIYFVMRFYMSGRPDSFLRDALLFSGRPKIFEHRPRGKRPVVRKL